MIFDQYEEVENVCYDLKLADHDRGQVRAKLNSFFNGNPPFTQKQCDEQKLKVNFNDLTGTIQAHDARAQLYAAFTKPGDYFTASTDLGPTHKKQEWNVVVTQEVNRVLRRSLEYYETYRSMLALDVLHGIGPAAWDNANRWCPDPLGIEDVLVPAGTYLTLRNLDRFALYRSYSWPELVRLTRRADRDPGWDMDQVQAVREWFQSKAKDLLGEDYASTISPEKTEESFKEGAGWFLADRMPTLDVYDFYFWCDENDTEGWYRRIIVDSFHSPVSGERGASMSRKSDDLFKSKKFLYSSRANKVAEKWSEIVSFQFADLSAVAPFRYHSVRSLGWLLYAPCMFQNILRCKFNTHVFENLMQYFRIKSYDDFQRALKVELIDKGFVDESVQFVPQQERWQINAQVVQAAFEQWDHLIRRSSASYTQPVPDDQDKTRKTAFQVQAEVNSTASLVAIAFEQAYRYQGQQYREIFRRFCNVDSTDPDVLRFRANCLRRGVPEKLLRSDAWDIEPERIMGSGNKSIEMGIANWLMQYRPMYDPEPQRDILRQATLMVTDDPAFTQRLVPESPVKVSDSVHDAELAAGSLWSGMQVQLKTGINHIEYVETMLRILSQQMQPIEMRGGMATVEEITGLRNIENHTRQHIEVIAQDPNEQQRVKEYMGDLTELSNIIKGYEQRLAEAMQKQQEDAQSGNGQLSPEEQAKIEATNAQTQAKIQQGRESHAAKTVQRQIAFEQKQRQDAERHRMDMATMDAQTAAQIQRDSAMTAATINNQSQAQTAENQNQDE